MSADPTLTEIFVHLYGPKLGKTVARLVDAQAGERVCITLDMSRPDLYRMRATAPQAEGASDAGPADPLPVVDLEPEAMEAASSGADVVVGLPPVTTDPRDFELRFLEELHASSPPGGRAVLLIPTGYLSSRRGANFRNGLLQAGGVTDMLFARPPSRVRGIHTTLPLTICRLEVGQSSESTRVTTLDDPDAAEFTVDLSEQELWLPGAMDPARAEYLKQWARRMSAQALADVADINPTNRDDPAGELVITAKHITTSGVMKPEPSEEDTHGPRNRRHSKMTLKAGDVIGPTLGRGRRWTVVPADLAGLAVDRRSVAVLAPRCVAPWALAAFMNSDLAELQLDMAGAFNGMHLPTASLHDVLVPDLSGIADLNPTGVLSRLEDNFRTLHEELTAEAAASFDARGSQEVRATLEGAQRDARLASEFIAQVRDPEYRATQRMPHPLARVVRRYRLLRDVDAPEQSYQELLRLGETSIVLLGATFAAYMAEQGHADEAETEAWRGALSHGGASLGHWLGVARKGAELARRAGDPLGGLSTAMRTKGPLEEALNSLLTQRNEDAHGGIPRSPYEAQVRLDELDPHALTIVNGLVAFTHADCFIVANNGFDGSEFVAEGRSLQGDHPDFAPWRRRSSKALKTDAIYLTLDGQDLALDPFCQLVACPTCLREETYYPDQISGDTVRMRSLERGHTVSPLDPKTAARLS